MFGKKYLNTADAAKYMGFSEDTLNSWRSRGTGPEYAKINRSVRYEINAIDRWINVGPSGRPVLEQGAECHDGRRSLVKRARGRAGAAQRRRRLRAEPQCRDCLAIGLERNAEEIDHIQPLSRGGADTDDNVRGLCKPCHAMRTRARLKKKY